MKKYMSDCAAGTIASVIAINEAGDRGDIWAHTEYSRSCNLSVRDLTLLHFIGDRSYTLTLYWGEILQCNNTKGESNGVRRRGP